MSRARRRRGENSAVLLVIEMRVRVSAAGGAEGDSM
jgi:hypothetical protein